MSRRGNVPVSSMPTLRELYATRRLRSLLDRVSLVQEDITRLEVDVIVNAAKNDLLGGGGVDGAIHKAAGHKLLQECRKLNGCATGNAKLTHGHNLPAKHVIHTVGPVYTLVDKGRAAKQLASCYYTSLELASRYRLRTIAFPAISTGAYSYPLEEATRIALGVAREFLLTPEGDEIDLIVFTVFTKDERKVYERLIPEIFPSPV